MIWRDLASHPLPCSSATTDNIGRRIIDRQTDSLGVILQSLSKEIETRRVHLAKRRNLLAPIHSLPSELLLEILTLAAESVKDGELTISIRYLMEMSAVSTTWWALLASASGLWTEIRLGDPGLRLAVLRSGDQPLKITGTRSGYVPSGMSQQAFAEFITPLANRWKSVTWEGRGLPDIIQALESSTLSFLEFLDLEISVGRPMSTVIPLQSAPKLRELKLAGLCLSLGATELPNLTSLSLTHVYESTLPSPQALMEIFVRSPMLETLELVDIVNDRDSDSDPMPSNTPRHTVPNLKQLTLKGISGQAIVGILSHIQADNILGLEVRVSDPNDGTDPAHTFLEAAKKEPHVRHIMHTTLTNAKVIIDMIIGEGEIMIGTDLQPCSIRLPCRNTVEAMKRAITALRLDLIKVPVRLYIVDDSQADEPMDTTILRDLQTISYIEDIVVTPTHLKSLFDYLSTPLDGSQGGWPCPDLTTISLRTEGYRVHEHVDELLSIFEPLSRLRPQITVYDPNQVSSNDDGFLKNFAARRGTLLERDIFGGSNSELSSDSERGPGPEPDADESERRRRLDAQIDAVLRPRRRRRRSTMDDFIVEDSDHSSA